MISNMMLRHTQYLYEESRIMLRPIPGQYLYEESRIMLRPIHRQYLYEESRIMRLAGL